MLLCRRNVWLVLGSGGCRLFEHLIGDDVGRSDRKVAAADQQVAANVQHHRHIDQDAAAQEPVATHSDDVWELQFGAV